MPNRLKVLRSIVVREHGIRWIAFVWSGDVARTSDVCPMTQFSSSFSDEKIVPSVLLVNMRPLGVRESGSVPDTDGFRHLSGLKVDLLKNDAYGIEIYSAITIPEKLFLGQHIIPCDFGVGSGSERTSGSIPGAS